MVTDSAPSRPPSAAAGARADDAKSKVKIETARRVFAEQVDQAALLAAIDVSASEVVTPLMFQFRLMERARADRQHIVLPEGRTTAYCEAAAILLRRGVADLTLLGEETAVRARASALGLDIEEATICPRTIRSWSSGSPRSTPGCARTRA